MARRTFATRVSTPRATARTSPQSTEFALPQGTLTLVEVVIPSGHAGLTGVALRYSGEHVWPWGPDTWIEADDEVVAAAMAFPLGGTDITILTFNTDVAFDHDHLLRFTVADPLPDFGEPIPFLPLAPAELDLLPEEITEEDVPLVGDELAGVTPGGGEIVEEPSL